jgi:hypothetical protein
VTIAVSVKVNDGLVFAADSAGTITTENETTNVYNNLTKIFNLHKGIPVAGMMYGDANIGSSSIATLIKDLRKGLTYGFGKSKKLKKIDPKKYSIEQIANTAQIFFDDEYIRNGDHHSGFNMGLFIGGYASKADHADIWKLEWDAGKCTGPVLIRGGIEVGLDFDGMSEPIERLVYGYGTSVPVILEKLGMSGPQINTVLLDLQKAHNPRFEEPAMPIQDAIDLAEFYAKTAISYWRFFPDVVKSVGGPIEIAVVTKHEGFTWIKRKHYFSMDLNVGKDLMLSSELVAGARQ